MYALYCFALLIWATSTSYDKKNTDKQLRFASNHRPPFTYTRTLSTHSLPLQLAPLALHLVRRCRGNLDFFHALGRVPLFALFGPWHVAAPVQKLRLPLPKSRPPLPPPQTRRKQKLLEVNTGGGRRASHCCFPVPI